MAALFPTRLGVLFATLVFAWSFSIASAQESLALPLPITFTASLSSDQLVTRVDSGGRGEVRALLTGKQLVVTGTYQDLSSPLNVATGFAPVAYIRKAAPGEDGPVVRLGAEQAQATLGGVRTMTLTTDGGTSGWFTGVFTLTDEQVEELKQGLYYVQLYTEENAAGELRGQLDTGLVLDASAEDMVGIWRDSIDGDTFQMYADGTWNYMETLAEVGEAGGPGNRWEFEDDLFTITWGAGSQVEYTELYRDGRRLFLVLEASGSGSDVVGTWYESVLIDDEGNRVNLR